MSEKAVGPGVRLHRLASLPTTTPESAGLWALTPDSIVTRSLQIQRSGFAAQVNQGAQRHHCLAVGAFVRPLFCVMAAVRGRLSGLPGSLIPGLRTCVWPPPSSFRIELWRLHQSRSFVMVKPTPNPPESEA